MQTPGTVKLKYLRREKDGRLYLRRNGRAIRLRSQPGTPEFLQEYVAAITSLGSPRPAATASPPGSFAWLVQRYYTSAEFRALSPGYQRVTCRILDKIAARHGEKPFALIDELGVRRLRDEVTSGPGAQNALLKALRNLFRWAVEAGHMRKNPAAAVRKVRYRSEGFHTWTPEEIARYEARWPSGSRQRLALALLLYTGARRSDVVRLGPENVQDGWLTFKTGKTGREVSIPIVPSLADELNAANPAVISGPFLRTASGKPFSAAGFGNQFRKWASEAGINASAHGLRKAGATLLAERGANEAQLRAIYGWSEQSPEPSRYTAAARRKRLAEAGMGLHSVPKNMAGTKSGENAS